MRKSKREDATAVIAYDKYRHFVCDPMVSRADATRRLFTATHVAFHLLSVVLAATVTILHYAEWDGAATMAMYTGAVHTVTLVVVNFVDPKKTATELLHMVATLKSYGVTKVPMPAHILDDMLRVNTWCVRHPLVAAAKSSCAADETGGAAV